MTRQWCILIEFWALVDLCGHKAHHLSVKKKNKKKKKKQKRLDNCEFRRLACMDWTMYIIAILSSLTDRVL